MLITPESSNPNPSLPDVASAQATAVALSLNWVGMDQIDLPLHITVADNNAVAVNSRVNSYVSLDNEQAKGIHMSRLYRLLNDYGRSQTFSPELVQQLLSDMIASHRELSCDASLQLQFDLPLRRRALLSDHHGWKHYPIEINSRLQDGSRVNELKVTVPYSSTCPCSASLARQLLADKIRQQFSSTGQHNIDTEQLCRWLESDDGSVATPHSQRSYAYIKVRYQHTSYFPAIEIIDVVENALKTPLQTAVKRADEQEFARLNAANLMFCEDAARRLKQALMQQPQISDYWLKVEHQESLHAHNAVALAVADIAAGFQPTDSF